MNIFAWIRSCREFSAAEQVIADYFLEHADTAASLEADRIIRDCHVSRAALYRFCSRCGFSGLRPLLLQMSADAPEWTDRTHPLDFSFPFGPQDSAGQIAESLRQDYGRSVMMTQSLLNEKDLGAAARQLRQASRILVFTTAANLAVAEGFRFEMAEIGKTVLVPADEYEQRLLAAQAGPGDFPIVITFAARGKIAPFLMEHFSRSKRPWLLDLLYALCFAADYQACVVGKKNAYDIICQG